MQNKQRIFSIAFLSPILFSASNAFPLQSVASASASSGTRGRILHMANSSMDLSIRTNDKQYRPTVDAFGYPVLEHQVKRGGRVWTRLEAKSSVDDIQCRQDVYDRIQHVKQQQSSLGNCELYTRKWDPFKKHSNLFGAIKIIPTFLRRLIGKQGTQRSLENNSFSVLQFNTLAEGLSAGPHVPRPFPVEACKLNPKDAHGGFTALPHPESVLDFSLRRWRLLEVLLQQSPDIMGLQEVDRYYGFFGPILCGFFGYGGRFVPKVRSPGVGLGYYSDGCALLYKEDTFELISEAHLVYKTGSQVGLLATLRHKASNQLIIVAVTHLKASIENEKTRCAQVQELLQDIQRLRNMNDPDTPVLLLGDFNADPPQRINKNDAVPAIQMALDAGYESAYDLTSPLLFTTYKTRGDVTSQRIIDYIFFQGLQCTHRLSIPREEEIEAHKLPGLRYPSDHLMIAGKFRLLARQRSL